ncbi:MAG TPA: orotidine-5'-phosphate decarboxylase [Aestuariivirgaceae bacterium]|nr:orotidine-5'-phosphate decarboxylase [Aestuariivirgaceae bacterium]
MTIFSNPIAVAIDTSDLDEAERLAGALKGHVGCLKLGLEFFYARGRAGYERLARHGLPIFLDLKLHDIPTTVSQALDAVMTLHPPPSLVNVHASGGRAMLEAAATAISGRAKLIAVTVLTSLGDHDLKEIGFSGTIKSTDHSLELARLAKRSRADGVVCSPLEVNMIKQELGKDFLAVVPGIRPKGSTTGDQKRFATPREAMKAGADLLVIGRPITQAPDPQAAARAIAGELADAG